VATKLNAAETLDRTQKHITDAKKTMDIVNSLRAAVHDTVGGRGFSDRASERPVERAHAALGDALRKLELTVQMLDRAVKMEKK